jgi:hypothetical protein
MLFLMMPFRFSGLKANIKHLVDGGLMDVSQHMWWASFLHDQETTDWAGKAGESDFMFQNPCAWVKPEIISECANMSYLVHERSAESHDLKGDLLTRFCVLLTRNCFGLTPSCPAQAMHCARLFMPDVTQKMNSTVCYLDRQGDAVPASTAAL